MLIFLYYYNKIYYNIYIANIALQFDVRYSFLKNAYYDLKTLYFIIKILIKRGIKSNENL